VEVGLALIGMAMQLLPVAVVMDEVMQFFAKNGKEEDY
jgi:hypothetical protein